MSHQLVSQQLMSQQPILKPASFLRRLAAIFYDLIIVIAILLIATLPIILLNQGKAIEPQNIYYQGFLLCIVCCYYIGFWVRTGQTTGMAAWRIKLITVNHNKINSLTSTSLTWKQAILRLITAIPLIFFCGIGLFYCLCNKNRSSLYDRIAGTRLIQK